MAGVLLNGGGMTRLAGRHIAPEMLLLLLMEVSLAWCLAYMLLAPSDGAAAFDVRSFNHAMVLALSVGFTSFILGLYRPQLFMKTRALLLSTALGGVLAFPAAWAASTAFGFRSDWLVGHDNMWPTKILTIWIGLLFALRLAFLVAVRLKVFVRRIVVLGPAAEVTGAVGAVRASRAGFFEVLPVHASGTAPEQLRAAGVRTALVSVAGNSEIGAHDRARYRGAGIEIVSEPEFWERHLKRIDIDHLTPAWFAALDARPLGRMQTVINRVGDIGISLAFLIFTLPLMLLVALIVRLDSPGPVLYRQERMGLGGRSFVLLKFRSMRDNAEARGPAWAQRRDPRVTRFGALMRRTRMDELPQLINVLKGEMSFIGPRPERPHFVEQLSEVIPHYRERNRVKPGLTGWAQVNFPYGASVEDARAKLSYDLYYVKNRTPILDVMILLATVRVILFQEGAR